MQRLKGKPTVVSRLLSVAYFSGHRLNLCKAFVFAQLCACVCVSVCVCQSQVSQRFPTEAAANVARLALFLYLPTSIFTHTCRTSYQRNLCPSACSSISGYFTHFDEKERVCRVPRERERESNAQNAILPAAIRWFVLIGTCAAREKESERKESKERLNHCL